MADYLYALAADAAPQSIPRGFAGHHDWDAIDDQEKARRGWVAAQPPAFDPDFERLDISFAQTEDGVWQATYAIVAGDLDRAMTAALAKIADRRWRAEIGGMSFGGQNIPTDREVSQPRILAQGLDARTDPSAEVENWKAGPGVYLTLDNATLQALATALKAHIQACFNREAEISTLLMGKRKVETLRATLAEELDKGWPA